MSASANNRSRTGGWLAPKGDGQEYLDKLSACPANTFENRFAKLAMNSGLGTALSAHELDWLYEAAFQGVLCNISFNGLGGCFGKIKPERENHRRNLEQQFMAVRNRFFATHGWRQLPASQKSLLRERFLSVSVFEANLAN